MSVQVDLFEGEPFAPRPAWRVIEAARMRHLTGELALQSDPPTNVYLFNGEAYFAERTTDGGISVRLLVEGVINRKQLSKGSVMVSGVEHLGRLFERDDSIDRHAVELCVELMTDDVLTSVAQEMVDGYTMTLYKRHPSGIDRWLPNQPTDDAPVIEDQPAATLSDFQPPIAGQAATNGEIPTEPIAAEQPAVLQPILLQPVLREVAREAVTEPVQDPIAAVVRAPEPVVRAPERLELDSWPDVPTPTSPTLPTLATMPTTGVDPVPAAAPAAASPPSISDEVAEAVRRALAAIDEVLVPDDDKN
jgi:hypothetical protein